MNFFIMVSLFLSAALGVFRGIDLALLTDAETGLCIVGPVWLRYGALAVAVLAADGKKRVGILATARLPASWHWRRRSAMERLLCCASSGCTAAW